MDDKGREYTDKELRKLEKRFKSVYAEALKDVEGKLEKYLKTFEEEDEKRKALVESGEMTKKEYANWRKDQVTTGKRWTQLKKQLAAEVTNANQSALTVANGELPSVFAENVNWGTYQIEHDYMIDTRFTLYDRDTVTRLIVEQPELLPQASVDIPKDQRWNQQHITSAVTQGLITGESMADIATRLVSVVEMSQNSAIRAARTAVTGAENAGRLQSYRRAEGMGINIKKQWLATLDMRTRQSHRHLDGESVEIEETFSNGCRFPGDPNGAGSEIYHCRCTMIADLQDFPYEDVNRASKLGDMSYAKWKGERKGTYVPPESLVPIAAPVRPRKSEYESQEEYEDARDEYRKQRAIYNESVDSFTQYHLDKTPVFPTKQAIRDKVESIGAEIEGAVLEDLDIRAVSEVVNVVSGILEKYPIIGQTYARFGSKFRFSISSGTGEIMEAGGGIGLSRSNFEDYGTALRAYADSVADGYTVLGDRTFATMVRHEMGHNLQSAIRLMTGDSIDAVDFRVKMDKEVKELAERFGSEYSKLNSSEAFAEGFSAFASGQNSDFADEFGKLLGKWLKEVEQYG